MDIAVIGAGITGLTLADRLQREGHEVRLFEASERVGGVIASVLRDGVRLERGPQLLQVRSQRVLDWVRELNVVLREVGDNAKKRFILNDGALCAMPGGPMGALTHPMLGPTAISRALMEPFVSGKPVPGESVEAFFRRRLGPRIAALADPLVAGIFGGDASKLEVESAFPVLARLQSEYGSLLVGMARGPRGVRGLYMVANGLEALCAALVNRFEGALHLNRKVVRLEEDNGWVVHTEAERFRADRVAVCCPAGGARAFLPELEVEAAQIAAVHLAWPAEQVQQPEGFGWLAPSAECREVLGCIWVTALSPTVAPGRVLHRVMMGGARYALEEGTLVATARRVLEEVEGITAEPTLVDVAIHRPGIPQYNKGHAARLAGWQRRGLALLGWGYTGVGVSACIEAALDWDPA